MDSNRCWLALRLDWLPIEARADIDPDPDRPAVIPARGRGAPRIAHVCPRGHALGLRPGMALSSARALLPNGQLRILERDRAAELARLESLACWAMRFTSKVVSRRSPDGLLLEIGGSRALLGEPEELLPRIVAELTAQGVTCRHAAAPVMAAAWALAGAGATGVHGERQWLAAVCQLPVTALETPPPATIQALKAVGLETIAACLRQPRDALARRHGEALLHELDRLTGRRDEPPTLFEPPALFARRLSLVGEVSAVEGLLMLSRHLLVALEGYLRARHASIEGFDWLLERADGQGRERLSVRWKEAAHDAELFMTFLRRRAEGLSLAGAVSGVGIEADRFITRAAGQASLIPHPAETRQAWHRLLASLSNRLGESRVYRIEAVADPRPGADTRRRPVLETADDRGRKSQADQTNDTSPWRPLWLRNDGGAAGVTPRRWLAEAEYVETGWWEAEAEARRAVYRPALMPDGSCQWLCRGIDDARWQKAGWGG